MRTVCRLSNNTVVQLICSNKHDIYSRVYYFSLTVQVRIIFTNTEHSGHPVVDVAWRVAREWLPSASSTGICRTIKVGPKEASHGQTVLLVQLYTHLVSRAAKPIDRTLTWLLYMYGLLATMPYG